MLELTAHPRTWLPHDFSPDDWDAVVARYDDLAARRLDDPEEVRRWLAERNELEACLIEHRDRLHVEATRHADDPAVQGRFLEFTKRHGPLMIERGHALDAALLGSSVAADLPAETYGQYLSAIRSWHELHRDENVPLYVEETAEATKYDEIVGNLAVPFEGESLPVPKVDAILESPDRERREAAYRAVWDRILAHRSELEQLYDRLVSLRHRIATNADLPDYRAFAFRAKRRFDYTPDDCLRFHDTIEETILPLARKLQAHRREALGLDTLRPWDLAVDPSGAPRLEPWSDEGALPRGVHEVIGRVHPELGERFGVLVENDLLDLFSRPGKASGGYCCTYQEQRLPFIFMNAAGRHSDVETLLHEGGHAIHAIEARDAPLVFNRNAPAEFAEVASMSMELMGSHHLEPFYDEAERRRARRQHLEGVVTLFPWIATIDAFQHVVYTRPEMSIEERTAAWLEVFSRYLGEVDMSGLDEHAACRWTRQGHLFGAPFYYIEYGIAQVGALQVWRNYRSDPDEAVRRYREALALGASRSLPELFAAAGARLDFGPDNMAELMDMVEAELASLAD